MSSPTLISANKAAVFDAPPSTWAGATGYGGGGGGRWGGGGGGAGVCWPGSLERAANNLSKDDVPFAFQSNPIL